MVDVTDIESINSAWRGGFPHNLSVLKSKLRALQEAAAAGPCAKSKRAALLVADECFIAANAPVGGQCTQDEACRAACASLCNHAEERVVLNFLRAHPNDMPISDVHVFHLAVDSEGNPRSKPTPSCVTCSRLMYEAGVEAVWLFGAHDILLPDALRWKPWPMAQFHIETLRNCRLPVSPALALRARLRIHDQGFHGTLGIRYFTKIEGVTIACGRHRNPRWLLDHAVERMLAAGVEPIDPTWTIAEKLKASDRKSGPTEAAEIGGPDA